MKTLSRSDLSHGQVCAGSLTRSTLGINWPPSVLCDDGMNASTIAHWHQAGPHTAAPSHNRDCPNHKENTLSVLAMGNFTTLAQTSDGLRKGLRPDLGTTLPGSTDTELAVIMNRRPTPPISPLRQSKVVKLNFKQT